MNLKKIVEQQLNLIFRKGCPFENPIVRDVGNGVKALPTRKT